MFKLTALIISACLALPASEDGSANQDNGRHLGQGPGHDRGLHLGQLRDRLDADKDGKLSPDERAAAKERVRERCAEAKAKFDTDHDGKLSDTERAAARAAFAARLKEKHPQLFARIDADGDGQLSKEECQAAREKLREWRQSHGERGSEGGDNGRHLGQGAHGDRGLHLGQERGQGTDK